MKYFLAIDIGASSGRHILGHVEDGKIFLEEIYRFDNSQVRKNGHDCWDLEALFLSITEGIKACNTKGIIPETIAIDTWGVDFVLLDKDLNLCSDSVAYRDKRTDDADKVTAKVISDEELYAITGIQKINFNTIYQLVALKEEAPEQLAVAEHMLMVPEYLNYRLTGKIVHDYTISSTTGLLNAEAKDWDRGIIEKLGLPQKIFGTLSMPGTEIGDLTDEISAEVGFRTKVISAAAHDTASAYLAVPAKDDNAVYISSGTWSLLGVENEKPITTGASFKANFTNEGGYQYRFRFLRNIMGLWMIQSIRREINGVDYVQGKKRGSDISKFTRDGVKYSYNELEQLARKASYDTIVNATDIRFFSPDSMIAEVCEACKEQGVRPPETVGEMMLCVYRSLAYCYKSEITRLSQITGKTYTSINIVGGGSKDKFLNELTEQATGLKVYAGPTEGTAIGNLIVQFIAAGIFKDLAEARAGIMMCAD